MDIYQWNSFYCNNSSDYRLIAKFDTAKQARAKVKELQAMLQKHADEYDELADGDDFEWPGPPTKTLERFGAKYGHKIQEFLIWGEEGLNDDMPSVGTVDSTLVLFHGYSSGGFGPDIPTILEKAGASNIDVDTGMPLIYAEFTLRKGCEEFADSLAAYVDQREEGEDLDEWMLSPPWESNGEQKGCVDEVAFARLSKGRCRFVLPVNPGDMESMSAALKDNATKLVVRIASKEDLAEVLDTELESGESEDIDSTDATGLFDPAGLSFLFTGKLASMSRSDAGTKTVALGGSLAKSVTKTLDVLVVGDDGSPLFGGGKKGSKLLKAEKLNSGGASIHIISETEFLGLKQKDNGGGKVAAKKDSLAFKANTQTPKVRKLNTPSLCWPHVVFGFGIADEKTIYAVGGYGSCVFLVSKDAGKSFTAKKAKKYRRSFRGIACEGKEFFAVGEHGRLIHSPDGKKIEEIELKTSACLYSVFRAQGLLWCTADDGIRRSKDDGKTWTKVKGITGKVFNAKDSAQGILFPNEKGTLFIARKGKVTRSKLAAKAQIWGVAASPLGTILCVGEEGGIYRSTDGGESWKTIKVAAMPKLKSKKASKEVFHTPNSLHCVACSDDGRFVIAGAGGLILASTDDGKSFVRIHQKFTEEWLFGATTWGDSVLLGGEKGLILAVG